MMFGIVGVVVGLIVRIVFFPDNFVLIQVFSSLEKTGLLVGMILFALMVVWAFDAYLRGVPLFFSLLALSFMGAVILLSCTYTGQVSLLDLEIPIPLSISLISIPVLIFYCFLSLCLHIVWEEWWIEFVTVYILLFAAIYTENTIVSLFVLSFSLVIIATVRAYGKHHMASCDVMIYRFGKPVRKRSSIFFVVPFIEEFRPVPEFPEPMKYYKETKEGGVIYIGETIKGIVRAIVARRWRGDVHCHLVFTNKRLIIARKGLVGPAARIFYDIEETINGKGKQERLEETKRLSPESILKSHKRNLGLSFSEITEIKVCGKLSIQTLYIYTTSEAYRFELKEFEEKKLEEVINSVGSLLADKVRIDRFSARESSSL